MNDKLELYDKIISKSKGFKRKGKTMFFTSSNGYMFSQLNKAGEIGLRLSKEDTKEFGLNYELKPFLSYGAKMREYVKIPEEALLHNFNYVVKLFEKGFHYVNSLPKK